ncbi:hypothetical protein KASHIRA_00240 [Serratia phage vB_SmaM-Kashira]|nr:hypothetical protein [Acinetobacter phage ABPH49]URC22618.1 hypothetical protein KASHIRA_00240 [Serratia phage vB_SmaM-Kashira]
MFDLLITISTPPTGSVLLSAILKVFFTAALISLFILPMIIAGARRVKNWFWTSMFVWISVLPLVIPSKDPGMAVLWLVCWLIAMVTSVLMPTEKEHQ